MSIAVGDRAPDFTLPDQDNHPVRLSELWPRGPVVLYFYPKDETGGCTAEACSFRDSHQAFSDAGAQVVGVSGDSVVSHRSFANHHQLPFTLLSDETGEARKLYGIQRTLLGLAGKRITFVIDRSGIVRHKFDSLVMATKHVSEALAIVETLK